MVKFPLGNSLLEYLLSFSIRDNGLIFLLQYIVFHTLSSFFSTSSASLRIISQSSLPFFGRLLGSASQHCPASFLYSSGAESGISGRSPLQIRIANKLSSEDQSLKGGSPLAI